MKIAYHIWFLVPFMAILFTACQKDNIDEVIPEDPVYQVDTIDVNPLVFRLAAYSPDSLHLLCIRIPYPVDFLQASGSIITIHSEAELEEAQMLTDSIVDFVYPFEATDNDGPVLIESIEDLVTSITLSCGEPPSDCSAGQDAHVLLFFNALNILTLNRYVYTINYPVTLIVEGTPVVINNDDEYLPAVGGSPFDLLKTELVYPITITQFGREIVLNSDEDVCAFYQTLDEPCENKPAHIQFFFNEGPGTRLSCTYFINYPVSIISNGGTIQVDSRDEYIDVLNTTPGAYDDIQIVFPVSVSKYIDGQQVSFGSDADICQYLVDCQ